MLFFADRFVLLCNRRKKFVKEDGEPFFGTGLRRRGRDVVCREIEFCPVILDGAESASICTKKPVEQKNTGL